MGKTMTKEQKKQLRRFTDTELISQLLKVKVVGRIERIGQEEAAKDEQVRKDTMTAIDFEKRAKLEQAKYQTVYGTFNEDLERWANSKFKVTRDEQKQIIGDVLGEYITIDDYVKKYGPDKILKEVEKEWEAAKARAN